MNYICIAYNSHYYSIRHSNRMTYSMFDILLMYNTSLNQTRNVITPTSRRVQLHSLRPCRVTIGLYHWPEGQWPHPPIFVFLDTSWVTWHLSGSLETIGLKTFSTPDTHSIDHMANSAPVACTHSESWKMEHYYILYFKSHMHLRVDRANKGLIY